MGPAVDPDDQVEHYADLILQAWRNAEVRRQARLDAERTGLGLENLAVLAASLMLNGAAAPRQVRAEIASEAAIRERNRWARVCARVSSTIGGTVGSPELMDLRRRLLDDDTTMPGQVADGEA